MDFILCNWVFCCHVLMPLTCVSGTSFGFPGTGVMGGCEPPWGSPGLNQDPLQEQQCSWLLDCLSRSSRECWNLLTGLKKTSAEERWIALSCICGSSTGGRQRDAWWVLFSSQLVNLDAKTRQDEQRGGLCSVLQSSRASVTWSHSSPELRQGSRSCGHSPHSGGSCSCLRLENPLSTSRTPLIQLLRSRA